MGLALLKEFPLNNNNHNHHHDHSAVAKLSISITAFPIFFSARRKRRLQVAHKVKREMGKNIVVVVAGLLDSLLVQYSAPACMCDCKK